MIDWTAFRHLNKDMNLVSPINMDWIFLEKLDGFFILLDQIPIITSSFREGDTKTHGKGLAVDIILPKESKMSLIDFYLSAEKFGQFTGIGIYPHWKPNGGLHVDDREDTPARWMGITQNGVQGYIALNERNLMEYVLCRKS